MKTTNESQLDKQVDEFEPIELGSVSEETKGLPGSGPEFEFSPNSME